MYEYNQSNKYHYKCDTFSYVNANYNNYSQCNNYTKYNEYLDFINYSQCNPYIKHCCKYDQTYSLSCFPPDINIYTQWNTIPYAGQSLPPVPETPDVGCWPLCFLKRSPTNEFLNPFGNTLNLNIKDPHVYLNLESEFNYISGIQCNLSCEQINIAKYWGDGPATKQFMPIADILIDTYSVPVCHASRILYILNGSLNDTFIVTWYLKYLWNIIRPCQYNQCFRTVLCTPNHPTYPAGHSTSAGCMAEILSYFFPAEREKLFMLARQCSNSRLYAGVHFKLDCDEGIKLGISIAKSILEYIITETNCNGDMINKQYSECKNANIIPITLNQYIPFYRPSKCNSFILNPKC